MSTPVVGSARAGPEAACGGAPMGHGPSGTVEVRSRRFGTLGVPAERIVRFVQPVLGFQALEWYAVIEDAMSAPVLWMQAIDAPEALFPVVDACLVAGDYALELSDAEVEVLELARPEDARLLFVLTLSPDPSAITVNLRAPVVWNTRRGTAMQLVLEDSTLSVSHRIDAVAGGRRSNKEVARARPDAPQE